MLILIPLVVSVIVLICVAVNKDSNSDNIIQQLKDRKAYPLSTCDRLVEKEKELTGNKRVFLFRGIEFRVSVYKHINAYLILGDNVYVCSYTNISTYKGLEPIYSDNSYTFKFVDDFINEAVPVECSETKLEYLLQKVRDSNDEVWLQIGDGEYFTDTTRYIYCFSDWKIIRPKEALELIQGMEIKRCGDPHKTHWQHFLELKMKAKKERQEGCVKFVDKILDKQKEYNDLQYKYEMLPSAPISDYESFTNFCNIVHEKVDYEEYEITNILLLKKSNLRY